MTFIIGNWSLIILVMVNNDETINRYYCLDNETY